MRPSPTPWAAALLLSLCLVASPGSAEVLVEELSPVGAAAEAGLRVGDRLLSWEDGRDSGAIEDPLALQRLEITRMPFGSLTLIGQRDGQAQRWTLPPLAWGITAGLDTTEPSTPHERAWFRLQSARALIRGGDPTAAEAEYDRALAEGVDAPLLDLQWSETREELQDRAAARAAAEHGLEALRSSGESSLLLEAMLLDRIGVLARRLSDPETAEALLGEALELRRREAPASFVEGETLYELHLLAFTRGELDRAAELGEAALSIYENLPSSEYIVARTRNALGRISLLKSDHETARERFESAMAVFERLDPTGSDICQCYTNLGILARRTGDLPLAQERFSTALALYRESGGNPRAEAMLMNNLGAVSYDRGDLFAAEDYIGQALAMREESEPRSMAVAMYLSNVAGLAFERGDLVKAEQLYLRALEIREEQAPEGMDAALSNENLGSVCFERGDLERSQRYFESALDKVHAVAPGSSDEARILSNMGQLAAREGELDRALTLHAQSLAIREELNPGGLESANSLAGMAEANRQLENFELAQEQLEQAVAICEQQSPGGLTIASYYGLLSSVHLDAGDPEQALAYAQRSLALRQALIPGSYWEAVAWNGIGKAQRAEGHWDEALSAFVEATQLLDRQDPRVGEIERSRILFRARHADMYRACIDARVQVGDLAGAVEDLERSRARSFLTMLGQRDLQFTADLPAELLAERRRNHTEYDRTVSELASVSPSEDPESVERLSARLAELEEARERLAAEVARLSPQLDALESPRSPSAEEMLAQLPEGTVMLAYSVGPERTHLFVMGGAEESAREDESTGGDLAHFTVEIPREELERRVREFRQHIERKESYESEALALYHLLVEPAAPAIESGRRILLSPDGPLHLLPFAALELPVEGDAPQFLVEWRPLHFTSSLAVYGELTHRTPSDAGQVVVFADPLLPEPAPSSPDSESGGTEIQLAMDTSALRGLAGEARRLGPLAFAREEAETIEELYGAERTTLHLGAEASEARVKALSGRLGLVHFACHGLADEDHPLNSMLILSASEDGADPGGGDSSPGDENGLLQSWEVLESIRFDAELVTLSACETALGADMGGEGLVSLVRSFQYAGAHSVLASLWAVADRPTAQLMEGFYQALRDDLPRDEALREAQLSVLRSGPAVEPGSSAVEPESAAAAARGVGGLSEATAAAAHPFYWAAFQIYGDPAPIH